MAGNFIAPLLVGSAIVAMAAPVQAHAQVREYNIPAGNLKSALDAYARLSGRQVIYRTEEVRGARTSGVRGTLSADAALDQILNLSGFAGRKDISGAVAIVRAPRDASQSAQGEGAAGSAAADSGSAVTGEIVVTAQKREERLLSVPVAVTAVNTQSLALTGQTELKDYFTRVPGLNFYAGGFNGSPQLSIRGLTTSGFENPVVGVVVDDVPFGSSKGTTLNQAPDLDPSDLARIEVLRGPQGTLYGASSMGGLLKYVTLDPTTESLSGRLQAGISDTANGHGIGYNLRGSVNVPFSSELAIRASVFNRREPGYIDNPVRRERGINEQDVWGGRLSALWSPSSDFSLKLSAIYQKSKTDGSARLPLTSSGRLEQLNPPGTGRFETKLQAYSATATAGLGSTDIVSVTGYNISEIKDFIVPFGPTQVLEDHFRTRKFSQEVRATVPLGDSIDWLIGGFYTHEDTDPREQILSAIDRNTGVVGSNILFNRNPSTFREYAAFTNLTIRLGERFDVQVGARQSYIKITDHSVNLNFSTGAVISVIDAASKDDAFTYLVTPRFRVSPDFMFYGRIASGYRAGGVNPNAAAVGNPPKFSPDKTKSYEIGAKGNVAGQAVTFDASVYLIDWDQLQVRIQPGASFSYTANAGLARSKGAELSLTLKPTNGLTISGWGSYNDAKLRSAFPAGPVVGAAGERLPNGARWSGTISIDQEFAILNDGEAYIGGTLSLVGRREGDFRRTATVARQFYPAYSQVDLRAGVRFETWSFNLFLNNLTDERGLLNVASPASPTGIYTRPRNIGATLTKSF